MEIFHLFYIRNMSTTALTLKMLRGTRALWIAVGIVVVAQLAATYTPFLQGVFATHPLELDEGMLIIGVGLLLFIIVESEKQLRLRLKNKMGKK
jgi:magnesium-transporting ATPase (P-type)